MFASGDAPPSQNAGSMFNGHLPVSALGDAPPSQKAGSVVPVVGHLLFASGDAPPSQKAWVCGTRLLDTCCLHQVMLLLHRKPGSVVPGCCTVPAPG